MVRVDACSDGSLARCITSHGGPRVADGERCGGVCSVVYRQHCMGRVRCAMNFVTSV